MHNICAGVHCTLYSNPSPRLFLLCPFTLIKEWSKRQLLVVSPVGSSVVIAAYWDILDLFEGAAISQSWQY